MPTGDGLLARIHPPLGCVSAAQIRAVANGARRFGNGHVDVTARANLQIRGVRPDTVGPLGGLLARAGLGDVRSDGGPQRLTLTSPLAGLHPAETIDVPGVARAVETAGRDIPALPGKTLVAIVGAGVTGEDADIVLRPTAGGRVGVMLAGDAAPGLDVSELEAAEATAAMLRAFADTGRRRVRDLSPGERAALREAGAAAGRRRSSSPCAGEGKALSAAAALHSPPTPGAPAGPPSPAEGGGSPAAGDPLILAAGLTVFGDLTLLLVEAPFGRCAAAGLDRLAEVALALGEGEIRTAPSRGFLIRCRSRDAGMTALHRFAEVGFVIRADDPRRAVAACPGAPACAAGSTPVPRDAERLAEAFAPFAARGLTAHVSGCAKGCAHPRPADLTLVAEAGRYRVVTGGSAGEAFGTCLAFEAAFERVRRADPAEAFAQIFRTDPA